MAAQLNSDKEKAEGFGEFLKSTKGELKKVHWPNRKELTKYTGVVLTTCLLMTILVWAVDSGTGYLLKLILK